MFDFPASPSNGQVYTTPTGVSYYWDATDKVWRLSGATMGAGSNLDADKLDGQDGSYYLDLANSTGTISDAQHGQRAGGNLHPLGTPTVAGFLFDAPADGLGYMRKGGVWVPSSGGAATDDLPPPGPLQDGQLWFKSSTGALYIWYDDGNSQQWVQVSASPQMQNQGFATKTAQRWNRIINGDMRISQEIGTTPVPMTTGLASYIADMTSALMSGSPGAGRFTAAWVQVPTPFGSANRLRFTVTTAEPAIGATSYALFNHRIEGQDLADLLWGTANAQQVVVRFGVCAPAGTYSVSIRNAASSATRSYVASFTITAAQAMVDTYVTLVIPGEVSGSWVKTNALGLDLCIAAACGATYAGVAGWQNANVLCGPGQSNIFAVNGQTFDLFDIGFHADPDKTGIAPMFEPDDYAVVLAKCCRYWQRYGGMIIFTTYGNGAVQFLSVYTFSIMRATPSASYSGISYQNANTLSTNGVADRFINVQANTAAAGAAYCGFTLVLNARM